MEIDDTYAQQAGIFDRPALIYVAVGEVIRRSLTLVGVDAPIGGIGSAVLFGDQSASDSYSMLPCVWRWYCGHRQRNHSITFRPSGSAISAKYSEQN